VNFTATKLKNRVTTSAEREKLPGTCKVHNTPSEPNSDSNVERYVKTAEEQQKGEISTYQRDWNVVIPLSLSVFRPSIHETTEGRPPPCCSEDVYVCFVAQFRVWDSNGKE
jgi:hypothetical protein